MRELTMAGARVSAIAILCVATPAVTERVSAQAATPPATSPRPWGRVSFMGNVAQTQVDGGESRGFSELSTAITYQFPDQETDGVDFGVDLRHSRYGSGGRPQRVSIYEGFVGGRMAGGTVRARLGHLWLNDLGALGSVAGGWIEYRQPADHKSAAGRLRIGAFGGLEPKIADLGYAPDVRKFGAYVALDGDGTRRNVLGVVRLQDGSVVERSVLTTTNFLPIGRKVFVYQAAEVDLTPPAGQGRRGLAYLFTNARISATDRVEVMGTYSRGRSVDTRGLSEDVLSGRPLTQATVEGLLYESFGGRVTVEVGRRVRIYGGYSRDTTNRDDRPTGRATFGGFAPNVFRSGFDITGSDSITDGPSGGLHARYFSVGRQLGRGVYVYGDYSTSLSVLHFSRSDGVQVELRPQTRRVSGSATINLPRSTSLMFTLDRTVDGQSTDLRLLAGITYRFR